MAYGPFDFSQPTQQQEPGFLGQMGQLFSDPRILAFGAQAGLQNLMPPGWGETGAGRFATAISSGGEAAGRVEEQQRKETETESKAALREAQATAAEARAGQKGSALEAAQLRADTARQNALLQAKVKGVLGYNAYLAKARAEKAIFPETEVLDYPSWVKKFGLEHVLGGVSAEDVGTGGGGGAAAAAGGGGALQAPSAAELKAARDAIGQGAPKDAVAERMRSRGIDPSGL